MTVPAAISSALVTVCTGNTGSINGRAPSFALMVTGVGKSVYGDRDFGPVDRSPVRHELTTARTAAKPDLSRNVFGVHYWQ